MFKTMYAITHVGRDGLRTLTRANQGRNHFETREAAERYLAAMLANNSPDTLRDFPQMEVRPVKCYEHGDAVGVYFD